MHQHAKAAKTSTHCPIEVNETKVKFLRNERAWGLSQRELDRDRGCFAGCQGCQDQQNILCHDQVPFGKVPTPARCARISPLFLCSLPWDGTKQLPGRSHCPIEVNETKVKFLRNERAWGLSQRELDLCFIDFNRAMRAAW
jgi:hypothetical protein